MKHRATAILLAAMMVATGVSLSTTSVAQQPTDCAATFPIADDEDLALDRILLGGMEEVGVEEVEAGISETLHVELLSEDDELEWKVSHLNSENECVAYTATGCGGTISNEGVVQDCTLDHPNSGVENYFVKFENPENDLLQYRAWIS